MRKSIYFLCSILTLSLPGFSQDDNCPTYEQVIMQASLPSLTEKDMEMIKRLPELKVPQLYKSAAAPLLPYAVDNSTQAFMRPVFSQVALECGQASGVAYNFTYEMNYRRNVSGNLPQNQYPTHYVWNFSNNGASCGVSFLESWEIIRGAGTVNVADYGGALNTYGPNIWLSGYDYYYNAMKNRIDEIYSINVSTAEGIQTLKHWIHDHLEGAAVGGVANFAAYATGAVTLPSGTPEAGKCVTVNWTPNTNHQLVIVGYNDSIRYDFNGDGQFTNNIDISGDGIVDVKDWEIGGVKWVNSFGTGVGNGGYCYTMYKNLADPKIQGGIWNNTVYVVIPKPAYEPRLTFKITVTDNNRSKLKVMAGVSSDTNATFPEHIMEFPVFNYQGGDFYMQGGTTNNANKTLEFGVDITSLLSHVPSGETAKYFLMINEKDPDNVANGIINSFSLIDYTPLPVQADYPAVNIPIIDNGLTVISINKSVDFPVVAIVDTNLPPASLYHPYSHQMTATGGTSPYDWEMVMNYNENISQGTFTPTGTEQLVLTNNSEGLTSKNLPFVFPFYGKNYSKIVAHVDGYLMFDDQPLPWPFIIDENIYQRNTLNIAPFMSKSQQIVTGEGDGIWYQGDMNSATIRWKTSISGSTASTELNYSVTLFPNGTIEFHYGSINIPYWLPWIGGISSGDLFNSLLVGISGEVTVAVGTSIELIPAGFPTGLEISKSGLIQGTMSTIYNGTPVTVMVRDIRDFRDTRTLDFTSQGIEIQPIINSGGDSLIQFGETCFINLKIKNSTLLTLSNPVFQILLNDTYLTLTDSLETSSSLNAGDSLTLQNCFSLNVSNTVPNNHSFKIKIFTLYNTDTLGRSFEMKAYSPSIAVNSIQIIDGGNGYLDPGETTSVLVTIKNSGNAGATGLNGVFSSNDPYMTVNSYIGNLPNLTANGTGIMIVNVTASTLAPPNYLAPVNLQITGNNQISNSSTFYLIIGFCGETFESNSFDLLDWNLSGDADWFICDSLPYEGLYCAQSGDIGDNDESILFVNLTIQTPGNISFYRRVSCEPDANNHNYDYLSFSIDGNEKARWDGEANWALFSYPVSTGNHAFKWNYHKDYSVSTNKDAAWVDMITFPPFGDIISFNPDQLKEASRNCTPVPNPFQYGVTFLFHNNSSGPVSLSVFNMQGVEISQATNGQWMPSGDHQIQWNATMDNGNAIKSGIYLYRLQTRDKVFTGKLIKK
ncbi:MAG: T9SS type A sorting domain-containing protein [Bacteroidales bacterium]